MCGIFGAVNFGDALSEALHRLTPRGPDDWGEFSDRDNGVYLGHRRLSVLDLSEAGRQPMSLEDGSLHLTYNGEVYNFAAIQQQHLKGVPLRSRTDTEVVLHAYRKFGDRAPEYFRGMFALGVYDKTKQELFLCRDRLGIKPLYYYCKGSQFAFASELSALKALPGIDLEFDPAGLDRYFRSGYIPAPFTAYKYIRKLKRAHRLIYDLAASTITSNESYWRLADRLSPNPRYTEQDWIDAIEDKIREATQIRLISDVPVGAFLSGGLDSSLIVALMAGMSDHPVKTFTVGFDHQEFDERDYAAEVAKRYGTEHHVEVVKPDAMGILPKLIERFGEPFFDASAIPTYYVSQIARKHITVALSGDGGDEVFAGYNHYRRLQKYERYRQRVPRPLRQTIMSIGKAIPKSVRGHGLLQRQGCEEGELYHSLRDIFYQDARSKLYTDDFKQSLGNGNGSGSDDLRVQANGREDQLVTKWQMMDLDAYLPEDILTKVDRMSMYHSLEVRVPLLDHELVELAFSTPESLRLKAGNQKHIIKAILADKVPAHLIHRKKQGFNVPISHWFRHEWKDYMHSLIDDTADDPFLETSYVREMFETHLQGGRSQNRDRPLYAILFYKSWLAESATVAP